MVVLLLLFKALKIAINCYHSQIKTEMKYGKGLQNCSAQWFFNLLKKRKKDLLDEKKLILNKDFNLKNIWEKIVYKFKNLTE